MVNVVATMAGTVFQILVSVGEQIKAGQDVIILESMKMEVPVQSELSGEVKEIKVTNIPSSISFKGCDKAIAVEGLQPGDASEINSLISNKKDLQFSCEFEVTNPDIKLGANVGQFVVEADYDYAVESTTTVDIKPSTNPITANAFLSDILNDESPLTEVLK